MAPHICYSTIFNDIIKTVSLNIGQSIKPVCVWETCRKKCKSSRPEREKKLTREDRELLTQGTTTKVLKTSRRKPLITTFYKTEVTNYPGNRTLENGR